MPEYLTVTEFAKTAGVTPQAVYKRLPELSEFVIVENGRKLVDKQAVSLFAQEQSTVANSANAALNAARQENERLLSLVEQQQAMLRDADQERRRLNDHIVELTMQITRMAAQAQLIAVQAQQLSLPAPVEKPVDNDVKPMPTTVDQSVKPEKEKTNRLPGWLNWLVNRYEA